MQAQLELLEQAGGTLTQARRIAQQRQTEARETQEAWSAHPLYPNDENQLRQQAESMTAPTGPGKALPIAAGVLLCTAAAALALLPAPAKLIAAAIGAASAMVFLRGGNFEQIAYGVNMMVGDVTGIICDGAKPLSLIHI